MNATSVFIATTDQQERLLIKIKKTLRIGFRSVF